MQVYYGCTEVPGAVFHTFGPGSVPDIPTVGRPAAMKEAYVLDDQMQPVPVGAEGEVFLGGQMAIGYLNDPVLTAKKFLPHPFSDKPGDRLFRTGDRGRWLPDGYLEILGRVDDQVKIRGFRVELGEIEVQLQQQPQVRAAVVQLREDTPDDPRLVAYIVTENETLAVADLRMALKRQLPDYMIPAAFVRLPALPLTPNGKIDRKGLPAPALDRGDPPSDRMKPRDNIERHLVRIWENVLNQPAVGVQDNFFDLGGHSLLAVKLMDQIERTFGRRLPLDTLWFRGGTIEAVAAVLRDEYREEANPELIVMKTGSRRPLFVVHTMGGNLFHYYDLARHLAVDQPVYGLQARGVFGSGRPDRSIKSIAAHCLDSMRSAQPSGPYLIAGFSSGGVVAYEIAHQLTQVGERVALLALLDSYAPRGATVARWLSELKNAARHRSTLRHLQEYTYFALLHPPRLGRLRKLHNIGEAHRWAHWSYRPQPYPHPIELFVAQESAVRAAADRLGWAHVVNGATRIHQLPGRHGDIVKPPIVANLAARLQQCIDRTSTFDRTPGSELQP